VAVRSFLPTKTATICVKTCLSTTFFDAIHVKLKLSATIKHKNKKVCVTQLRKLNVE